jgi:hypothetical protein
METKSIQQSIDEAGNAGRFWPYSYLFRTAQAKLLAKLSDTIPELNKPAEFSMSSALLVDPRSIELLGALFVLKVRLKECDGANEVKARLLRLAPDNERVMKVVETGCG